MSPYTYIVLSGNRSIIYSRKSGPEVYTNRSLTFKMSLPKELCIEQ